ncbi:MAG: electron transport complex subunit RsxC [Clostridiales bacterium]|nr:electron transport complex subunit RsxC [Clostridiales bacterium]MDD7593952.1 electron transport complex subunit RsxC [Clostridiales bacterium]
MPFGSSGMFYTFKGGTRVREYKNTRALAVVDLPAPPVVEIPLSQHIGVPCTPTVAVGDRVLRGQLIGEVPAGLGCPVHSSVSGTVKAISSRVGVQGRPVPTVIIENDGEGTLSPDVVPFSKRLGDTSPEEIVDVIRRAGISGMGGATFPTWAKLSGAIGKVNRLIINCAECEPFITVNHRLMLEHPEELVGGAKILLRALGLPSGDIAIEDNKLNAADRVAAEIGESPLLNIKLMRTKYPQGDERQLIFALTGREVPEGKLPADVGCVVFNAETCSAIYRAFAEGMPLIERCVTVDGDCVREPKNLRVPLGTPVRSLIEFCGGLVRTPFKLINGGPMMGAATWDFDAPVTKGTSAILVFSEEFAAMKDDFACIRCGRCVKNCPMHLMPVYLAQYAMAGNYDETAKLHVMSCVECGTCSYNCPGNVPIVQYIRVAKGAVRSKGKK